jgi:solute:Na+ symporter, SSS family
VLGMLALLGLMAIAAGVKPLTSGGKPDSNTVVPLLFDTMFPDWFAGIAFAAIGIGALVPAAIMSIAAANLFTRNVWKEHLRTGASEAEEAKVARLTSLLVKVGALLIILLAPVKYAIDFQLLGGVWIIQTLPAVIFGLYTRWFHRWALVAGWAVGMVLGTTLAIANDFAPVAEILGVNVYNALTAVIANLVVAAGGTLLLGGMGRKDALDETRAEDFDELAEDVPYHGREREPAVSGA